MGNDLAGGVLSADPRCAKRIGGLAGQIVYPSGGASSPSGFQGG